MRPPDHCAACDAAHVVGQPFGCGVDYAIVPVRGEVLRWLVLAHPGTADEHEALRSSTKRAAIRWIEHVSGKLARS